MINFAEAPSAPSPAGDTVALTHSAFSPQGWLCQTLSLEHRPQQEAMALATAQAFTAGQPLLFEAGTGVGKSLAYLIPGIIHAITTRHPFVISSHTIALQQQIEKKDLATCRHLFQSVPALHPFADFKVCLLVGRGNYLCGHRLSRAIETKTDLFGNAATEDLQRIADWSLQTQTGMREELSPAVSPEVWDWVNADSSSCNRKNCNHDTCFYRRALARRAEANILIVNHSLLFSLLSAGLSPGGETPGILYPNDFLVLDEAHTVPDIATSHFGQSVSSFAVERLLRRLFFHKGKKPTGLLAKIGDRHIQLAVTRALAESETFFNEVRARFLRQRSIVRMYEPDWTSHRLGPLFMDLVHRLKALAQEERAQRDKEEIHDQAERLQIHLAAINDCVGLKNERHVYWLEKTGRQGQITTLRSAPIDVAPALRDALFARQTSVLMTSATLTTAGRMDAFRQRAGADGIEADIEHSPFDYQRRMKIFIAEDAPGPAPGKGGKLDLDYLADMIRFCATRNPGGTLVLFTSHADLAAIATTLEAPLAAHGLPLLAQGRGMTRAELKAQFIAHGRAVLFGTDSFWTGFDVPGRALSQVIITRLPFENPGEPIKEARSEAIRLRGGNPFAEMTLPEAVIKFRQGIGRLIRTQADSGVLTLLDSRLLHKPYGRWFLESLPHQHYSRLNRSNRDEVFPPEEDAIYRI